MCFFFYSLFRSMTPLVVSLFNTKSQRNKKVSVINWTSNIPSTLTDLTICHVLGRSIETIQSKKLFFCVCQSTSNFRYCTKTTHRSKSSIWLELQIIRESVEQWRKLSPTIGASLNIIITLITSFCWNTFEGGNYYQLENFTFVKNLMDRCG